MGLCRNLTFCFVNMLNYGILWAPFLLKVFSKKALQQELDRYREQSLGLPCSFLKTFAAVYPDVTCRPWVSKDGQITAKIRTP